MPSQGSTRYSQINMGSRTSYPHISWGSFKKADPMATGLAWNLAFSHLRAKSNSETRWRFHCKRTWTVSYVWKRCGDHPKVIRRRLYLLNVSTQYFFRRKINAGAPYNKLRSRFSSVLHWSLVPKLARKMPPKTRRGDRRKWFRLSLRYWKISHQDKHIIAPLSGSTLDCRARS